MAKPELHIKVQPTDGDAIGDLPLAAAATDESTFVKLVVRLDTEVRDRGSLRDLVEQRHHRVVLEALRG